MSVGTLLGADPSRGRVALTAKVALGQSNPPASCPAYFEALEAAIRDEPPPFDTQEYDEIYRAAAADGRWMAVSLITNAEREGDGAKRLWSLAACCTNGNQRHRLKVHAVDESRHALLYLALLDLSFPGATAPSFRQELDQLSPKYSMRQGVKAVPGSPYAKEPSIDDYVQMNIAEIRTTIHHLMQRRTIVWHRPLQHQPRIVAIQNSLLRDELRHVLYTAVLIEDLSKDLSPGRLAELFRWRMQNFNQITTEELGASVFDCSVACCAKRPWCRAKASDTIELGFVSR